MHVISAKERPLPATEIRIRQFQAGDAISFRRLNEEWITRFFRVEPKEELILADPKGTILDHDGRIFFAAAGDRCIGCCALIRLREKEFELAKMAVETSHQGAGVGRRLLQAAIGEARSMGARRVYLETNHILTPAIHLYESQGFKHIDPSRIVPSQYQRADVYMELLIP
jgi:putative acetyltransferase